MIEQYWDNILRLLPQNVLDLIDKSKTIPQSSDWHPENEVYNHIKIVFSRAIKSQNIDLIITAIFHDLGKVSATKLNKKGNWSAYGHEFVSTKIVEQNKEWISLFGANYDNVKYLVNKHMRIKYIDEMKQHKRDEMINHPLYNLLCNFSLFDNMQNLTKEEKQLIQKFI